MKVLFYGQSIAVQKWWKDVADDLRRRFPHADLQIENRAIGGFAGIEYGVPDSLLVLRLAKQSASKSAAKTAEEETGGRPRVSGPPPAAAK